MRELLEVTSPDLMNRYAEVQGPSYSKVASVRRQTSNGEQLILGNTESTIALRGN